MLGCNNKVKEETYLNLEKNKTFEKDGIIVKMEGETHYLKQENIFPQKINFNKDSLMYYFHTKNSNLQVNLNLTNTNILQNNSATYTIPDANKSQIKVDLSFYNKDRDASRINKRIVFRKGKINIKKLTKNNLILTFEGEGSGMIERKKNFPINGSIKITY